MIHVDIIEVEDMMSAMGKANKTLFMFRRSTARLLRSAGYLQSMTAVKRRRSATVLPLADSNMT
jgi:hypothetical protein